MKTLVERCGLVLSDVFKTDIHGTSYVFVITKKDLGLEGTAEMLAFEEEKGLVQSVDTVYELSGDEKFYRLVISIHGLSIEDTSIIHTKFIFKTDLEKRNIIEDSFIYLYCFFY